MKNDQDNRKFGNFFIENFLIRKNAEIIRRDPIIAETIRPENSKFLKIRENSPTKTG